MDASRTLSQSIAIYESGVHAWGDRWTAAVSVVRRKESFAMSAPYNTNTWRAALLPNPHLPRSKRR